MTELPPRRAAELALFRHAPQLEEQLPWLALGSFPSPVEPVRIGERALLVKRDDLCADGYAGNKVRKLEFLLGSARAAGARRLITAGAAGSHHAFATAYHGIRQGFAVSLVLFPQRITDHVRDMLLLDAAAGAELRWVRRLEAVPYGVWRARMAYRGKRAMVIPPGGSNAVGTLGYVNAGLELAEQVAAGEAPRPSSVHVAAGTLGTVAGLAIGLAWAGLPLPVIATRITARIVTNERVLARLVRRTLALLQAAGANPPQPDAALRLVRLRHDQIGTGYGHETAAGREAVERFRHAGLELDATYTAKAAAALLSDPPADTPPLFWHTLSAVHPRELEGHASIDALPAPFAAYVRTPASSAATDRP